MNNNWPHYPPLILNFQIIFIANRCGAIDFDDLMVHLYKPS